jgi:16S rRNA (adenine1518-N6/adenine1519-N6)-dimethyltransferase
MSVVSVAVQALAMPHVEFVVPPSAFLPPPNVDSAVITLTPLGEMRLPTAKRTDFFRLVNAGFRHKRKQILNSLTFELDMPREEIVARLTAACIDPMRRAQTLSVDEWLGVLAAWQSAV